MHAPILVQTKNFMQHVGFEITLSHTPMRELRAHVSHKYSSLPMHWCERGEHGGEDAICTLRCISAQSS